ncbi:MAG: 2-C-methyl-D-erythritol 2,4-cyclodiphosphate synthase [Armatimonadetes bacterium]|nr:2-C-methyl-D-erythritol 2,4-cyclodiphosphate synthase [Armatimonadota bacterium]
MAFAVLLAAGNSSRFGSDKLRLMMPEGMPLWRKSFDALRTHRLVSGVGVVCPKGGESDFRSSDADFVIAGGETRKESSLLGVAATPTDTDVVLVHDAARPFADAALIERVIRSATENGAAVPVLPVHDTVGRGGEWVEESLDREGLFRTQTPQGARREWLLDALSKAAHATDEASALKAAGYPVKVEAGSEENIKVTVRSDIRETRSVITVTGFGYDIHRFSDDPARPLLLGGVHFPGSMGLEGHSDADVVLHAVADALLGTCGLGDIGQLYPDTDPAWHNADSLVFLREAARLVSSKGGTLAAIDITVLAETPKLGEGREQIRAILSKEVGVAQSNINVKATTMEGLGAIGRGEGIAAMAVATVIRPLSHFEV